jgi:hypothetical protein
MTAACAILAAAAGAQITLPNSATSPTSFFITTVEPPMGLPGITLDNATFQLGGGALQRAATPANQSYVPTGFQVNPVSGFTIQFWFRSPLVAPGGAAWYMFGDPSFVHPTTGQFRCFRDGIAGPNNLVIRGIGADVITTGAPLIANTWVHIALRYTGATPPMPLVANQMQWFINGAPNTAAVIAGWTGMGTNLSFVGFAGSSAQAGNGHWDDIRIDSAPRTDADILANYLAEATGPAVPDKVYLKCNSTVAPHTTFIGTNGDPTGTATRLITAGSPMEWGGNSPNQSGNPASCFMNLNGPTVGTPGIASPYTVALRPAPPMPTTHVTPGVPGLQCGFLFSGPPAPFSIMWPDGLGIGFLCNVGIPIPYAYQVSPNLMFTTPGFFQTGDRIDLQFVALDANYPSGIGTANRATFVYQNCPPQPHARVEARGAGAIQVLGFWEVHNTGGVSITRVVIDATTATGGATGFVPAGALNSGGTLQAGTSYRFGSNTFCGLTGGTPPGMFTGLNLFTCVTATAYRGLQFDFNNFNPCTDVFVFDCDSCATNLNGNAFVGATVTVTFSDSTILSGPMILDPNDPRAAIIDL